MSLKWVSVLIFLIIINLLITTVSGVGEHTVDIYETKRTIVFRENQTTKTIYMNGAVNYSGYSSSGDTIHLNASSKVGESSVTPTEVTFYSDGSQEFTLELTINNVHRNGKKGSLVIEGYRQTFNVVYVDTDEAEITIYNYTSPEDDDHNPDKTSNSNANGLFSGILGPLIIVIILLISAIYVILKFRYVKQ
jgi:hypothetical protein